MIPWLPVTSALADDHPVPHGFVAPDGLALFVRAGHAEAKGTTRGDDCAGAVAAALADLGKAGAVLSVDGGPELLCKQRKAGDAISASLVELSGWWVVPGSGPAVPAARQLALAQVLTGLLPAGRPLVLEAAPAGLVLTWGVTPMADPPLLAEPADRAAEAFAALVSPWIPQWAPILGALPELAGARFEVGWPTDKAKNAVLRFTVPKAAASAWLGGDTGDDVLVRAMEIAYSPDPKKVPFQALTVDVEAGTPRPVSTAQPESRPIDVKQEDLEGLEDEP